MNERIDMTILNPSIKKVRTDLKPRKPRTTAAGRELIAAMKEVHRAVTTGDYSGMTVREVEIPDPRPFNADDVRALRKKLGASIAVFAQLCGVSSKLVEHWEQGRRTPAPLACRLLERIAANPADYLASLVKRREMPNDSINCSVSRTS
jgi:DNA-binding transcriptional regulator YiaG